jgi:predicted RNase H-like nuclease
MDRPRGEAAVRCVTVADTAMRSMLAAPATGGYVAGVDGCRGGWMVALRRLDTPADLAFCLVRTFAEIIALPEAPVVIAVDMPIGLPDRIGPGGRGADRAARANLGARQSSVFAVPARSAVMEVDYRTACGASLLSSDPPRKISKQAFNLFPKIREIDALMTPALQNRVVECHPELAFWSLNGRAPLAHPKKVASRAHPAGMAERRALLARAGYDTAAFDRVRCSTATVGVDDVLDAAANSWAAARIAAGLAQRFPTTPDVDSRGLRIEIWAG